MLISLQGYLLAVTALGVTLNMCDFFEALTQNILCRFPASTFVTTTFPAWFKCMCLQLTVWERTGTGFAILICFIIPIPTLWKTCKKNNTLLNTWWTMREVSNNSNLWLSVNNWYRNASIREIVRHSHAILNLCKLVNSWSRCYTRLIATTGLVGGLQWWPINLDNVLERQADSYQLTNK